MLIFNNINKKDKINSKKTGFGLLTFSVFLHVFCLFCAVYKDIVCRWPNGHKHINYWLNLFSWWSAQASLITIVYFIYKLFKKSKNNYFDKVFDLIVINSNIVSISIFTISAIFGLTPLAKKDEIIKIFSWEINSKVYWWFYSIIWHYLAPVLTVTYFIRQKNKLADTYAARRRLFWYSFLHPLFYFVFVLIRPSFPGATKYPFTKKSQYPYLFFDWLASNDFKHIFWALLVILVIFFWLIVFWLSTLFFWKHAKFELKEAKNKKGRINK